MKKMSKLVMAAILAVALQGTAMATVTLEDGTGAKKYANELISTVTPVTVVDTVNATTPYVQGTLGAPFDVSSKLGFGVSKTQTRFIRYDLTGVEFGQTVDKLDLVIENATDKIVAKQDATYVIFQVTATADLPQNHPVGMTIHSLKVTDKLHPATIKYSLYENAFQASAGLAPGRLAVIDGVTIADFTQGLDIAVGDKNRTTADVTTKYLEFKNGVGDTLAKLGDVRYTVIGGVLNIHSDEVELGDLIKEGSKLVITTNKSLASAADIYLATVAGCGNIDKSAETPLGSNTAEIILDDIDRGTREVCYVANGDAPIAAQDFQLAAIVVPEDNTSTQNVDADTLGYFIQDGTVLRVPFYSVIQRPAIFRAAGEYE